MAAEAGVGIAAELLDLLAIFLIAAGVGVFVAKVGPFPYTIALLLAGLAVSVLGVQLGIELSHDLILLVLLPPLLFEGAATTDLERFRADLLPILTLAIPGLLIAVTVLGFVGQYAFGFPLLIALLFGAMILPTDPVSVLALFEEVGAPDRLSTLVEGESLINDGAGVVVFSTLLALVGTTEGSLAVFTPDRLTAIGTEIVVASLGGAVVGFTAGYAVYRVMANVDEHMTEIVLTFILAYGAFLVAEHYLHVSGVIATVVAGLLIGNRGAEEAMSPQTKISVFNTWDTAAFLVNTFIFLLIGAKTPVRQLLAHWRLIAIAVVLVLAVRALVVYPLSNAVNALADAPDVDFRDQHVLVWGGLHASIPIALVLGLPPGTPFRTELRAMVFGVAAFSLVVQGLTMERLLDRLGVITRSDAEELYELLTGRARAVDSALEAAEDLRESGQLPPELYADFTAEYEREKEALNDALAELLRSTPELRREELLIGERRVLKREKSAVMDAMRQGLVSDPIGEELLEEVDLKLDRVRSGESTVRTADEDVEGYEEFWRQQAREYGLDVTDPETGGESED